MKNAYLKGLKKATSGTLLFLLLFSLVNSWIGTTFASGPGFLTTEVQSNEPAVSEVKASRTLTVNSVPTDGETIQIGTSTITFMDITGETLDQTNTSGGTGFVDITEGAGDTPRNASQIASILRTLTNVFDIGHGQLNVTGGEDDVIFTTSGTETSATEIGYTDGTSGDITSTSSTTGVIAAPAVAQVVEFEPVNPEDFLIFRAKINGFSYNFQTSSSTSLQDIVQGLQASMDTNDAVTCTEDDTLVTCTADVAGTAFAYETEIVDKEPLYNAINAEFTDGASRTTYKLTASDYTPASWSAYEGSISSAITLQEVNSAATTTMVNDAITDISTKKSELQLAGFTNLYDITDNSTADINPDADSYNGVPYVTYERDGNIYFKEGIGAEELVGAGTSPAIAVGAGGVVHIAYENAGNIMYAKKTSSWSVETAGTGSSADIDSDSSNFAHIVYQTPDYDYNNKADIIYTNNTLGNFGAGTIIWDGYWRYDNGAGNGRYYWSPHIKIDSSGYYHIISVHHAYDKGMGWQDHNYYVLYTSNISGGINKDSGSAGNWSPTLSKNSLTLDGSGIAHIIYNWPDGNYYHATVNGGWSTYSIGTGIGNPSISADGTSIGIAYANGVDEVRYMQDDGYGFIGSTLIGTTTSIYPTVTRNDGETFIYYVKNDGTDNEVKLASTTPVYSVPGQIDNAANSFVSSLGGNVTLSSLETGGVYSLMSGSTLVSSGVLVASGPTGSLQLNPSLFTTYGKYTLTLSGSYDGTTTSSIDSVDLYISPVDYVDMYVNTIGPALLGNDIQSNLGGVSYSDVMDFPGLYFEIEDYGNIAFSTNMNLTDSGTISFLQNLPSYLSMDSGFVSLSGTAFSSYPATITMYNLPKAFSGMTFDANDFIVKSNTGATIDGSGVISGFDLDCFVNDCSIEFDTAHFTSFDLKPVLTGISYRSNNAYSGAYAKYGDKLILEFTGSEALTGTSIGFSDVSLDSLVDLGGNHYRATSTALTGSLSMFPNFSIRPEDLSGNMGDVYTSTTDGSTVLYDITNPSAEALYSPMGPATTALDVIATLANFTEPGIVVTNNSGLFTYTFSSNGSFTFNYRDKAGNTGSTTASVNYINKSIPVITLNGSGTINIEKPGTYTELGATWSDQTDGTGSDVDISGTVNTGALGTYTLYYTYENSLGLTGTGTRIVNVVDTIAPTISEVTAIDSIIDDNTPSVVISASELSTPSFSGSCTAGTGTNTIGAGNNTITFNTLSDGAHNDCYITLTDEAGNHSTPLHVSNFTVDTTAPVVVYKEIKNIKDSTVDLEVKFIDPNMGGSPFGIAEFTDGVSSSGSHNMYFSGSIASTTFTGLDPNTDYTYTFSLSDMFGHITTQTGTFQSGLFIPSFEGDLSETGALQVGLDGDLNEGDSYDFDGYNVYLYSDPSQSNSITGSLLLSGVTLIASEGDWDGSLIPPTLIDPDSTEAATGSEVGTGVTIVQTIKAGAEGSSISATGGYFEVSFMVPGYPAGTTFSLFRSNDGITWTVNTPDSHCTLDADLMCSFRTDHLSFFAPGFDNEPDAFSFTALTDKELSTSYESNTITVSGIDTTAAVTIVGGEYRIGAGAYTSGAGSVVNGDTVTVRRTSSASYSTLVTATLTIGLTSGSFNITTKAAPSGGGGGGGGAPTLIKDDCTVDYSPSYYDKTCGTKPTSTGSTTEIETENDNDSGEDISLVDNTGSGPVEETDTLTEEPFTNDLEKCFAGEKLAFPDIANSWAKCYIMYLNKVGIIDGKEGNYLPQASTTRAEFIKMVLGASKIDYSKADTSDLKYDDVKKDSWQAKVVKTAIDNGLVDPNNSSFRPDDAITRIESLKIMLLSLNTEFKDTYTTSFTDLSEDWMIKYVEESKNMGLIEGQTIEGKLVFRPLDNITRAESSKITVKLVLLNK